ncbi:hypothetical protein, conserved [Eimeria maxima]|uniref:Uncharacterized protein n=1 Tax=Eimeria maxima TaxID=5804 RepID=U6MB59_EIMMA|nr:hypothetical protein, conserved [Eimeria maxima]CDJ59704.1 hypothetical protein, conserved [Eimeria maxima]
MVRCEEAHLKTSSDESLLLQGPIGLGSGEEDVLQTEKAESEGEAEYTEETVIPVPSETTTEGSSRDSSANCFSLVRTVKPEPELPLPPNGQSEGLLECQDSSSTSDGIPEASRPPVDSASLPRKLKISPTAINEGSQCPPPVPASETSLPCSSSPQVSTTTPVLPYVVPLGSAGTVGNTGTSGGRPWACNAPRLPMVSIAGETRGPALGSVGCFISSVFLGTNSHTPILPGGAAVASSALPGAVGQRFSGLGGPSLLPSAFSLGASSSSLSSWPQHHKQQQQQAMYLRPHLVPPASARPAGNMPVILTALRRHLRSLIRIMYNKQHGKSQATSSPVHDANAFQKDPDAALYARETVTGSGASVGLSEEQTSAPCCLKSVINGSQSEYAQCSGAVEMHEILSTYKHKPQYGSLMAASKQGNGTRRSSTTNPQLLQASPQDRTTESQEDSTEVATVSGTARRGTATVQLAGSSRESSLLHLGTPDGAAESWEGQQYFHEEHLDACSLSELSEYLQIFSSFLSLSLSEVSRQEPATLQHVRLQLLLLRNSHQQQPTRLRQAKHILQRWPPLLQSSTIGGPDGDDEATSLNGCPETSISPVNVCLRNTAAAAGASRTSMLFSSTNLFFLSSFSSPPSSHVDTDVPSITTSAMSGEKATNGCSVSTGQCEAGPEQTAVRNAGFPSSSVDAFSVDGPPTSSSNSANVGTPTAVAECPLQPPLPNTFVATATNDNPGGAPGLPPSKDKLALPWNSDGTGTSGVSAPPAAGLRLSPVSGTAIGIRLHNLIGGTPLGLSNTLSLSGSSGGGAIHQSTEAPTGSPVTANSCCAVGALLEGGSASLALSPGSLEWIRDGKGTTRERPGDLLPADGGLGGRRQCSSRRASDRGAKGKAGEATEDCSRSGSRTSKETNRKAGSAVTPIPQVTIGLAGPPGGAFNLAKSNNQEFILPKSDFSASRVARLSRRAMELPYVHGVRFEAANFAWVAQMRGEARRFLVKKHGFVKSRLCAIEKIEMWRAALSPEALASELKAEQDVLAMVPNMCPEDADPDAMQAVEESLRLKFQRGTIMSCRSSGGASLGLKRQRNFCLDSERDTSKANRSHDTFSDQLLVQHQQVMTAQQLITQPSAQADGQRHQFQIPQSHLVQSSQQQLVDNSQQHLLTQEHLFRAIASPASNTNPTGGRDTPEQPQQQQVLLPLEGFRTRGQQQQLLSHHFPSGISTLPAIRLQQHTVGASSQQARPAPE